MSFESDGLRLVGTLVVPARTASVPAVLIVPGSGRVARDGCEIAAICVYRTWAERLARSGFAVLRYDKRFITHPDIDPPSIDLDEQIADAVAALGLLRSTQGIDGSRLFILGHSEGGTLAPLVAERAGGIAGVVLVGAPVFPIDELFLAQLAAHGSSEETIDELRMQFTRIRDGTFPPGALLQGAGAAYWRQFIEYTRDAPTILARVPTQVLAMQGLRDENFPGTALTRNRTILREIDAGSSRVTVRELPGVTHSGLAARTGRTSPRFVRTVRRWLVWRSRHAQVSRFR